MTRVRVRARHMVGVGLPAVQNLPWKAELRANVRVCFRLSCARAGLILCSMIKFLLRILL